MEKFAPAALLLDMDGLLVDSEPLWARVETDFCAERGATWTAEHARANVGRGVRTTVATMCELFGFDVDPDRGARAIVDAFVGRVAELELKTGCLELLDAAKGRLPAAIVSSSDRRLIDAVLGRFDLLPRFDAIVSGDQVKRSKPAPDIFLLAAERLGVEPARCAALEDSLAGATAAHAAGAFVVAIPEAPFDRAPFERVSHAIAPDLHAALALLDLSATRSAR